MSRQRLCHFFGTGLRSHWPHEPGPGRDETFGLCTACHGYKLVSNQGMTRDRWNETMTWMTERHGMPDTQGADRHLILDYLATHHPPKAPTRAGGFRNPFAPQ